MKQGQFRVRLRPCDGGAHTQVQLCGVVATAIPARSLKRLAAMLSFWSGWPVAVALSVGLDTAGWCELWSDGLKDVPERHLEVRFVLPRHRVRSGAGGRREL